MLVLASVDGLCLCLDQFEVWPVLVGEVAHLLFFFSNDKAVYYINYSFETTNVCGSDPVYVAGNGLAKRELSRKFETFPCRCSIISVSFLIILNSKKLCFNQMNPDVIYEELVAPNRTIFWGVGRFLSI